MATPRWIGHDQGKTYQQTKQGKILILFFQILKILKASLILKIIRQILCMKNVLSKASSLIKDDEL